jgi:hypothetical protein
MDKENVIYIHNATLFCHEGEQNRVVWRKMDGTAYHHFK